jgi:flavin reductase (DIM6/NTAB) family NADH-FMN oxidoreductase RutF
LTAVKTGTNVAEDLKQFMREFPQGVTLVTTNHKRELKGITVSSFTSLSVDPPLILIAIAKNATSYDSFTNAEFFSVQLLASNQDEIATKFASKIDHAEKFRGLSYTFDSKGNPIIDGILANLECERDQVYDAGDHSIVVAKVTGSNILKDSSPLVYRNRKFTTTA